MAEPRAISWKWAIACGLARALAMFRGVERDEDDKERLQLLFDTAHGAPPHADFMRACVRNVQAVVVVLSFAGPRGVSLDCEIIFGDLLEQRVDVIVNAWNRNLIPWWLLLPQGVSGAIKRRGGSGPFRELAGP
jgi:hypothetical protein